MSEGQNVRRESGMLVLGIVLGTLFGIVGGLWSAIYVEWLKSVYGPNLDWTPLVIVVSIFLIGLLAFMVLVARWALKNHQK